MNKASLCRQEESPAESVGHQISVFMTNSSTAVKSVKDLPFASTIKTGSVGESLNPNSQAKRIGRKKAF